MLHALRLAGSPLAAWNILILLVLTARAAGAQPQVQARIIDRTTRRPIERAAVSILGQPGERLTDADGRVTWQVAPAPPFELLVILPGGRFTRPFLVERLPEDGPIEIAVESLVNETLTVAAGAAPNIESTPAAGLTLLTREELATRAPANLAQAVENVAGVSMVSEGHAAVPAVRGFSAGRTLILLDGARVSSERRVGPSATFLDPFVLDSIEVARGPGSVAYGSDAFGGVIYARTRRVARGAPPGFRFVGGLGAGVPTMRGGMEVSKGFEKGSVLVQAHARDVDDYRGPRGDVFNSGARDLGVMGRVEYTLGPGTLSASWQSDFGRDIERPRNNSQTVRFYYPAEDSHRFTASYDVPSRGGFDRISTTAFLGSYAVVTDQDRFGTATAARTVERSDVTASDFQVRVVGDRGFGTAQVAVGMDVNGRFGLEAFEDRVAYDLAGSMVRLDRNVAVENAYRTDAGFFGTIQIPVARRLLAGGGLRGDYVSTTNQGGYFGDHASSNRAGSGYVSATLGSFSGFTLTGQVARGFRDPVLSDRYFRGPTGRGFITGNPDLEPETSLQFDGAIRYTGGRYRAAFYAFHYRIDDLIERYQTTTDFFFFRNRGRSQVRGIEIEAQADLGAGYALEIAGQVTRGRVLDGDLPVDGIPPSSLSLQLRKQLTSRGYLQVRGAAYDRDDDPGPTERITPGYAVLDIGGGWNLSRALELRVMGRNLLDKDYFISPDTRTVLAPGRSVLLTLNVKVGG